MTRLCCTVLISLLSGGVAAFARENVCLKSGFCVEADSHSRVDDTLVLRVGDGTLEYATQDVISILPLPEEKGEGAESTNHRKTAASDVEELLSHAALEEGLYPEFVRSVAKIESNLQQQAVSRKNAVGLMQLMPQTAAALKVDRSDASENALGGAKYLRALLIRYHGDSALALAAYNAGPETVDRFHGVPPYPETRNYVVKVLREYERQHKARLAAKINIPTTVNKPTATN